MSGFAACSELVKARLAASCSSAIFSGWTVRIGCAIRVATAAITLGLHVLRARSPVRRSRKCGAKLKSDTKVAFVGAVD